MGLTVSDALLNDLKDWQRLFHSGRVHVCMGSCAWGHPLPAAVNRHEQNPATASHIRQDLPERIGPSPARLVLTVWLRRDSAPVTHQDQGFTASQRLAPGCVCSPRKPSVPHRLQSRQPSAGSAAQVCGFALRRSNPLWLAVRALSNTVESR
jgi:hypothetical protein